MNGPEVAATLPMTAALSRRIPRWMPNAISVFRIFLVPAWLAVAEHGARLPSADGPRVRLGLLAIIVALGVSDVVDGYLARRFGLASATGATLDAVADKIAQVALVTYLVWRPHPHLIRMAVVLWAALVARDVLLGLGYGIVRRARGTVNTEHEAHGKLASFLLFLTVVAAIAGAPRVTLALTVLTVPVVVVSTAAYLREGWRQLRA